MALLHRAAAAHAAASGQPLHPAPAAASPGSATLKPASATADAPHSTHSAYSGSTTDTRMPQRFLGVAGVYDICKHYAYESDRGVQELSTMKRAIGGLGMAAAVSPSVIIAAALQRGRRQAAAAANAAAAGGGEVDEDDESVMTRFYDEFPLAGEAIAHRIGER